MEITSSGVIYVALLGPPWGPQEFDIYRSVDGGRTFTVWSAWVDAIPGDVGHVADFVIAEGTSDRAFLAFSTPVPGGRNVRVAWANLTPGPPTWNFVTALSGAGADFGGELDLETDAGDYDDYYLYLAAANDSDGRDIWFTRSTDMGAAWETGYRAVNSISTNDFPFNPKLTYGASEFIHLAYDFRNLPGDPYAVEHRRIGGFAGRDVLHGAVDGESAVTVGLHPFGVDVDHDITVVVKIETDIRLQRLSGPQHSRIRPEQHGAQVVGPLHRSQVFGAGDQNNGGVAATGNAPHFLAGGEAVHDWHVDVHHDQHGAVATEEFKGLGEPHPV